jgi:hypothetical protein
MSAKERVTETLLPDSCIGTTLQSSTITVILFDTNFHFWAFYSSPTRTVCLTGFLETLCTCHQSIPPTPHLSRCVFCQHNVFTAVLLGTRATMDQDHAQLGDIVFSILAFSLQPPPLVCRLL